MALSAANTFADRVLLLVFIGLRRFFILPRLNFRGLAIGTMIFLWLTHSVKSGLERGHGCHAWTSVNGN